MGSDSNLWLTDIHKNSVGLSFKIAKTLFTGRSKYQRVEVVESKTHGAMLINDGAVMFSERDEFVYHEMMAHVPLFVHPRPEKVLVVGGGDGGTVREVLKHASVSRVVLVEIDEMVIQACRKYIPAVSSAMDDPRLETHVADGVEYVADTDEVFDVVLVDSTDPVGAAVPLFGKAFYEKVSGILSTDGIMVTQAESPYYDHDIQLSMLESQRSFFQNLHIYLYSNLTYTAGLWGFGFASKGICPLGNFDPARVERSGISTRYYNAGVHCSAFMLPQFVREDLEEVLDPLDLDRISERIPRSYST